MAVATENRAFIPWTPEEREIVRRDYDGSKITTGIIAYKLGRTFFAVKGCAAYEGVTRRKADNWTPEQIEHLQEMTPKYTPGKIAGIIGRTRTAIVVKQKRLHLSRRAREGWYTKSEACAILGVDHHTFERWVDAGLIKMRPHNPGSTSCNSGSACWEIKEAELKKFITLYPGELQGRNVDLVQLVTILAVRNAKLIEGK